MRGPMRSAALLAIAAAIPLAACRPPCVQLAEKICRCEKTQVDRDTCLRRAQDENGRVNPSPQDEQTCADLVDGCDCNELQTPEGKQNCGLARFPDAGT